jgi:6-pyruvoyltetrahydropterin/6-carboxytetrahydropterin synthase
MYIFKTFTVDATHNLPNVPLTQRCKHIHGHTFRIEVHVKAPVQPELGWVVDFADIAAAFKPIKDQLDHKYLNKIEGLENPTSENLAKWIWRHLSPSLPILCKIVVQESPDSGCIYTGEDE